MTLQSIICATDREEVKQVATNYEHCTLSNVIHVIGVFDRIECLMQITFVNTAFFLP